MSLDGKNIFLAGSTGMAGTAILKRLLDNYPGIKIRAAYHSAKPFIRHKNVEYAPGDLRLIQDSRRLARGCDCAIMAAAYAGGAGFAKMFPWEHMKENLMMNVHMLEAFHLEKVRRVIFIGSAALYQEFEGGIKEDSLDLNREPHEAYFGFGWTMRFIEKMCRFLNRRHEMEIIIARSANIFGPYDKFDPEISNFIPALIRKAADKMDPFEVWGGPDVTRDVVYADDVAAAVVMMADRDEIKYDIFNIGSGVRTTVGDVVKWALKYTGHKPSEIKYLDDKPTAIKFRALDCEKARTVLGWEPRHSIEDGIRRTAEWWLENKDTWTR